MNTPDIRCISFDCYGTLIDWETGLLTALHATLPGLALSDDEILTMFAEIEPQIQATGYKSYRVVLREVLQAFANRCHCAPLEPDAIANSIASWKPFPDTAQALERMKSRFRMAVLSNIDNDLFVATTRRLSVPFDYVITAQEVGAYKPSRRNFEMLLERTGLRPREVLHVAESLFHDIAPAQALGIPTVWVNRANGRSARASKLADTTPDVTVCDLNALADRIC
ncbi:MAG TPA: haloacid dehalogenase type II [Verrucomicrobiae bacterium]|nr:haloacid dehalogenase type II [Verrucomicrobiae bacterium]